LEILELLSQDPDRSTYERNNDDLSDILYSSDDINKIKERLEQEYNIKIYFSEKKEGSGSYNNGCISLYKNYKLV
jgi:hypothetical protein